MILSVEDVRVEFPSPGGSVRAIDGVSLQVGAAETLAVVGESGCGKTTLARVILGLQPTTDGKVTLNGREVRGTSRDMGEHVGMVWQDPYASLDPRWKVSRSIAEAAAIAGKKVDVPDLFDEVGLDRRWLDRYPHQLSGGQRQRVAIGRAISLKPPLVICDEPTAALDLSIRAQILNTLRRIQKELKCSYLYISHDLLTVQFLADRVAVMYLGRIVETGPTEEIFQNPRHPYTKALLESAPDIEHLKSLPSPLAGELPDPRIRLVGCRFAARCTQASSICEQDPGETVEGERSYFCHNPCRGALS